MEIDEVHHLPNTAMIKPKKQANKETVHLCSELRTQKENHIPPFSQKGKPLRLRLQNYPGTPSPLLFPAPSLTPHGTLNLSLHLCVAPAYPACPITGRTFLRQAAARAGHERVVTTFLSVPTPQLGANPTPNGSAERQTPSPETPRASTPSLVSARPPKVGEVCTKRPKD